MRRDDDPVVVEQTYRASVDTVWNAITQIDLMRQWYFDDIPSFEPEVGFETQFNVRCQGRDFLHVWTVTDVAPLRLTEYNWKYEGYPGDSLVVFELFEQSDSTKLRLTHRVDESFPEEVPEFSRDSCLAGWTFFVKQRLKGSLE